MQTEPAALWQVVGGDAVEVAVDVTGQGHHARFLRGRVVDNEHWHAEVEGLFRIGKALPWIVGDLLNYGEAAYGEQAAQVYAVAEMLDYSFNTVQQWKSVSGRIPMSERTEDVPWSTWRLLAGKTPEERRAGLKASADGLTTGEIKELLSGDDKPEAERPPCPICGGETTATRCKSCAAGFSGVAWHFADTTPLERALRQPEVKALKNAAHQVEVLMDTLALLDIAQNLPPQYREDWPHIHTELIDALAPFKEVDDA